MAKITTPVNKVLERANMFLANPEFSKEFKQGVIAMLEDVLHESGNYNGFMFLRNVGTGVEAPRPQDPDYFNRKYF